MVNAEGGRALSSAPPTGSSAERSPAASALHKGIAGAASPRPPAADRSAAAPGPPPARAWAPAAPREGAARRAPCARPRPSASAPARAAAVAPRRDYSSKQEGGSGGHLGGGSHEASEGAGHAGPRAAAANGEGREAVGGELEGRGSQRRVVARRRGGAWGRHGNGGGRKGGKGGKPCEDCSLAAWRWEYWRASCRGARFSSKTP